MTGRQAFADTVAMPNAASSTDFFSVGIQSFANGGGICYKNSANMLAWLGIGTVVEDDVSSNVSCANNAYTSLGSITLTAGTWVISAHIYFVSSSGGVRTVVVSTASGSTSPRDAEVRTATSIPGGASNQNIRASTTRIVTITANTTYYLKAYQSSGAALNATGNIKAVRVG